MKQTLESMISKIRPRIDVRSNSTLIQSNTKFKKLSQLLSYNETQPVLKFINQLDTKDQVYNKVMNNIYYNVILKSPLVNDRDIKLALIDKYLTPQNYCLLIDLLLDEQKYSEVVDILNKIEGKYLFRKLCQKVFDTWCNRLGWDGKLLNKDIDSLLYLLEKVEVTKTKIDFLFYQVKNMELNKDIEMIKYYLFKYSLKYDKINSCYPQFKNSNIIRLVYMDLINYYKFKDIDMLYKLIHSILPTENKQISNNPMRYFIEYDKIELFEHVEMDSQILASILNALFINDQFMEGLQLFNDHINLIEYKTIVELTKILINSNKLDKLEYFIKVLNLHKMDVNSLQHDLLEEIIKNEHHAIFLKCFKNSLPLLNNTINLFQSIQLYANEQVISEIKNIILNQTNYKLIVDFTIGLDYNFKNTLEMMRQYQFHNDIHWDHYAIINLLSKSNINLEFNQIMNELQVEDYHQYKLKYLLQTNKDINEKYLIIDNIDLFYEYKQYDIIYTILQSNNFQYKNMNIIIDTLVYKQDEKQLLTILKDMKYEGAYELLINYINDNQPEINILEYIYKFNIEQLIQFILKRY